MSVPLWVWLATVAGLVILLAIDLVVVDHDPHEVTMRESAAWVSFYIGAALAFGAGLWLLAGRHLAGQFFAGYVTEYSLSVDNLFVFIVLMSAFAVPRVLQHKVLLIGIVLALAFRALFIAAGAAAIHRFDWVFYVFGAFLIYTAVHLARHRSDETEFKENALLRFARRHLPVTDDYDGARILTRAAGRRMVTPMLIVIIAIGTTDVLFALDSIPAIFGLTKHAYLVFTANAFALMGLRQLYFLLGGLLTRLVYLSLGLSLILGFIGVKLVLEALHLQGFAWAPEIPISISLGVIIGVLVVTAVASLLRSRQLRGRDEPPPSTAVPPGDAVTDLEQH